MHANSWHHKLFDFPSLRPSESGKYGKEEQKIEYLENEKSFLDEIKSIFH